MSTFWDHAPTGNAQSIGTYNLATIPATKRQRSRAVPLSQATYNASNNTVRLVTRRPLAWMPTEGNPANK